MEALAQVLSCSVCLELFTPPVLVLSCAHNFCKKCLEKILISQKCSHVNGQFSCPMCRKIIPLRGRGIIGLPRNILVESILEKFKYELENVHAKEKDQLSQICEEHGEHMNLVCLTDDKPICAICKLFGEHESHNVAKLSEVYLERKKRLIKDLDWVNQQSEYAEQAKKEIEMLINDLTDTAAEVKVVIDATGAGLLKGIQRKISELKATLGKEYSMKVEKLQQLANELEVPRELYHQMKTLLEQHSNSVHFLQEDKILRSKIEKLAKGNSLYPSKKDYHISVGQYFKDLIRATHIDSHISSSSSETPAGSDKFADLPPRSECPIFSFSDEMPNESFYEKLMDFPQKANEMKQDLSQNVFDKDNNSTPNRKDI